MKSWTLVLPVMLYYCVSSGMFLKTKERKSDRSSSVRVACTFILFVWVMSPSSHFLCLNFFFSCLVKVDLWFFVWKMNWLWKSEPIQVLLKKLAQSWCWYWCFLIDFCLCVLSALHFSAFIQYKCWCWFYHYCPALWAYFLYFLLGFLIILTLCRFVWCIQPTLVDSQSSISFFFFFVSKCMKCKVVAVILQR